MSTVQLQLILQRDSAAIMGIINATPDSFSDGGQFAATESAVAHGLCLAEQGADILDVGGESTRPGADAVSLQEELDRVVPVIEKLAAQTDTPISIDTYKAEVMTAAVEAGASMINDVNALRAEGSLRAAADAQVPVCLMHMLGEPRTMQQAPDYDDVVKDITAFLKLRIDDCVEAGITRDQVLIDPGIGFGKTLPHNLLLLNSLPQLKRELGSDLLIGVSRKSFIDKVLGRDVNERLAASVGLAVQSVLNGAKIVRVHDVRETHDAIRMAEAVQNYR